VLSKGFNYIPHQTPARVFFLFRLLFFYSCRKHHAKSEAGARTVLSKGFNYIPHQTPARVFSFWSTLAAKPMPRARQVQELRFQKVSIIPHINTR
jgi:uncharacterized membrane protein